MPRHISSKATASPIICSTVMPNNSREGVLRQLLERPWPGAGV
jgi:hypothetical protein